MIQALNGLSNIFLSLAVGVYFTKHNGSHRERVKEWWRDAFCYSAVIPVAIFLCLRYIYQACLRCIRPKLTYYFRYVAKASQRIYVPAWQKRKKVLDSRGMKLQTLPPRQGGIQGEPPALATFLHIDILTLVSQHSHYTDLLNLSLASKAMREVIFPADGICYRHRMYKLYTCQGGLKSECWVCRRQICKVRHKVFRVFSCTMSFNSLPATSDFPNHSFAIIDLRQNRRLWPSLPSILASGNVQAILRQMLLRDHLFQSAPISVLHLRGQEKSGILQDEHLWQLHR